MIDPKQDLASFEPKLKERPRTARAWYVELIFIIVSRGRGSLYQVLSSYSRDPA